MPYNSAADSFHTKKLIFVADFLQAKCDFRRKSAVFDPPLGGLGATYDDHLRHIIGKRVVDFPISVN